MLEVVLRRLFGGSREETPPKPNVAVGVKEKDSKRKEKYGSDIEALKLKYGAEFKSGVCIEIPLKNIINLCPRERRKTDAYTGLVGYLKSEYGVTLNIISNKTK